MSKSRKDLKSNDLAAITDQFEKIKPHLPKIIIGVVLIVAIVFGINYLVAQRSATREAKAASLILYAVANSSAGSSAVLDKQVEEYPDDITAGWALLMKADQELVQGINRLFEDKEAGRDSVNNSIRDFEQAFKKSDQDEALKIRSLFGWARALETNGKFEEATSKYREVLEFGDSPFSKLAEKAIARVSNPDNQEFFVLYSEKSNNVFESETGESAPMTDSGLPSRPDFTYPGEEPVLDNGGSTSEIPPNINSPTPDPGKSSGKNGTNNPKQKEEKSDSKASKSPPPVPPKSVVDESKKPESGKPTPKEPAKTTDSPQKPDAKKDNASVDDSLEKSLANPNANSDPENEESDEKKSESKK